MTLPIYATTDQITKNGLNKGGNCVIVLLHFLRRMGVVGNITKLS